LLDGHEHQADERYDGEHRLQLARDSLDLARTVSLHDPVNISQMADDSRGGSAFAHDRHDPASPYREEAWRKVDCRRRCFPNGKPSEVNPRLGAVFIAPPIDNSRAIHMPAYTDQVDDGCSEVQPKRPVIERVDADVTWPFSTQDYLSRVGLEQPKVTIPEGHTEIRSERTSVEQWDDGGTNPYLTPATSVPLERGKHQRGQGNEAKDDCEPGIDLHAETIARGSAERGRFLNVSSTSTDAALAPWTGVRGRQAPARLGREFSPAGLGA